VKNKLAEDLLDWGIRLVRLNIETPKILDKTIADEMAKNSLVTAKTRAEASTLSIDYSIKQQRAHQEAEKKRIEMERDKENKIVQAQGDAQSITIRAQAELDAAKLKAEAERIEYENRIRKEQLVNETAVKRIQMENEAQMKKMQMEYDMKVKYLDQTAQLYNQYEGYRQLELNKAQADAVGRIGPSVISPEVAQSWYANAQGLALFNPVRNMPQALSRLDAPAAAATAPKAPEQQAQPKLSAMK
jgi:regulator of protease activity HflC (stomatin/prohibitin superfamily)